MQKLSVLVCCLILLFVSGCDNKPRLDLTRSEVLPFCEAYERVRIRPGDVLTRNTETEILGNEAVYLTLCLGLEPGE